MKPLKLTVATLSLVATLSQVQVQADQTNLVQTINVHLQATSQGATTTNRNLVTTSLETDRVNSGDIIASLGVALGTTFSQSARLVLVTPVDALNFPKIEVRDGSLKVEVTGFVVLEQVGGSVTRGVQSLRTGDSAYAVYSIQRLALQDIGGYEPLPMRFDVRGLGVDTESTRERRWPRRARIDMRADVTGSGDSNGAALIMQGSVTVSGGSLEVVSGDLPPPV
jgi:hypothetical protein